ncbi:hypothetical protein V6N12_073736 [Hibiscus sabdariffa]|uniref:Uncharacterized protein n=1 Tax=Hibiscus sabdariffa TaxID=183260 RepID=A0ABR2CTB3_9ROSI
MVGFRPPESSNAMCLNVVSPGYRSPSLPGTNPVDQDLRSRAQTPFSPNFSSESLKEKMLRSPENVMAEMFGEGCSVLG